jgi:hypothetical protein
MYAAFEEYWEDPDAGIWKSNDGGKHWSHKLNANMDAISVDPRNSSSLCAVGEAIYTSSNGGTSWKKRLDEATDGLFRDPARPNILYTLHSSYSSPCIYKSTNGGVDWIELPSEWSGSYVYTLYDISIDPGDTDILYLCTDDGTWRSSNGGESWTKKSTGLPSNGCYRIDVDPSGSGVVYGIGYDTGVYRSENNGNSWWLVSSGIANNPDLTDILIKRDDPDTIYVSDENTFYVSTDGAASWRTATACLDQGIDLLVPDPKNAGLIWGAGRSTGIYRASWATPDTASTWYLAEGSTDWDFGCWIRIENPNESEVTAEITYMPQEGSVQTREVEMAPMSHTTIEPSQDLGEEDFSTKVV